MNNLQQQNSSWHAMYPVSDRQKVVQILSSTLEELSGANFDSQRASAMAQEYEKFTFMKASTREDYLRSIKSKVTQLRSGQRNVSGINMNKTHSSPQMGMANPNSSATSNMGQNMGQNLGQSMGQNINQNMNQNVNQNINQNMNQSINQNINQNINPSINPNMRSNMSPNLSLGNMNMNNMGSMNNMNNMNNNMNNNINNNMNNMNNVNSMNPNPSNPNFVQRQAMQAQLRNGQPAMQNAQQLQQISNMIRNSPIPQALLSKIPNLPLNVNTWSQIFDCIQKKMIPANVMPLIKEIHNTHIQLAIRQSQQRKLSQMQRMNPGQTPMNQNPSSSSQMPANPSLAANTTPKMGNVTPYNLKNLSPQQKQQLLQRHIQRNLMSGSNQTPPTQPPTQPQPQQQVRPTTQPAPQTHSSPQMQAQAQAAQQMRFGNNGQMKQPNFQITPQDIMKYSSDALSLLSRLQSNGSVPSVLEQGQKENFIRKFIIHQKTQMWKQQSQMNNNNDMNSAVNKPMQPHVPSKQQSPAQPPQASPMISNMGMPNQPMVNPQTITSLSPNLQHGVPGSVPLGANSGSNQAPMNFANQGRVGTNVPSSIASLLPPLTDEMKMKLWQMIEEVSRNNIALKDVTMILSAQDKTAVREAMARITQQYANVDSIITYFYMITRYDEGTKRLIQTKYMTKNIMESLQRGVYLASPDLLEKLRAQYQKYYDYVKEQFAGKRQQLQNQQAKSTVQSSVPSMSSSMPGSQPQQRGPLPQKQDQMYASSIPMQYMNANQRGTPVQQPQMPPSRPSSQIQQPVSIPPNNQWNNQMPPQSRTTTNSSPWIPQASPPLPTAQTPVTGAKMPPKGTQTKRPASSAGATKKKTKTSSVGGIPTPSGNASTPGSMSNPMKTPNSIPTPQVGANASNKGTPTGLSPSYPFKNNETNSAQNEMEIFSDGDGKLKKRRELSNSDPEKFFFASLTNLLDLDEATVDSIKDSNSPPIPNGKTVVKSPLSPASTSHGWTAEIKPLAITTAFQQVDYIRNLASDIIKECDEIPDVVKQENGDVKVKNEVDGLIGKDNDAKLMYEPTEFDTWKEFIVANID